MRREPVAAKPELGMNAGTELLPWSWATEQLAGERNYWVVTARRDGFPQARPLWGVFMDDRLFISVGSAGVQRAANDPRITVHIDSAVNVVILEGRYRRVGANAYEDPVSVDETEAATVRRANALYNKKYGDSPDAAWVNFVVEPRIVYGWRDEDVKTSTRWTFT